jgi:ElaB/YqjD/DUF883 family membrane-anchored ribosome-binding protein
MATTTVEEPTLATLQADMAALRQDLANLVAHLQAGASSGVQGAASRVDAEARRIFRGVAAEGERSADAISRQVEEQPLVALLIALGVGYIGGRLLSR